MNAWWPASVLGALALLQMAADLTGLDSLKGVAAATAASPAPKVFSAVGKLETYAVAFVLEWTDESGTRHVRRLDSELYERLRGPYNRRNVYGAVLAFGPVLAADERTRPMFDSVLRHATCNGAPLLRELGLASNARNVRVRVVPAEGADLSHLPLLLRADCP
ncbi:MAG TPA: hypothetical protein VIM73_10515 [Polyangiaceae bacterium]